MSRLIFSPVSLWAWLGLILLLIIGLPILFFVGLWTVIAKLGIWFWIGGIIVISCIIGSFVNLPLTALKPRENKTVRASPKKPSGQYAPSMYDKMYNTQRFTVDTYSSSDTKPQTQITINLGGALIPVIVSAAVIINALLGNITDDFWYPLKMLLGIGIVTAAAYLSAKPVHGIGIAIPFFIPLLTSLITALIFGGGFGAAAAGIGYVSGTLGILIGGDLLHLKDINTDETPMLSIGGAGTFDGIFLTGIITAFIAALF